MTAELGVYAVLWCGSAARGEADAYSDLDFHALVTGDHRWRSSFVVNGVPVEVFHNPARKIWALLAEPEHATVAMFAEGRVLLDHPDLDALVAEARALSAAGPAPRPLTPAERHLLVDEVVEARSTVGEPVHTYLVSSAAGQLVRSHYTARGWWEVKPRQWLRDLVERDPATAQHLRVALTGPDPEARQMALEALARHVLGRVEYGESATAPEPVLPDP